VSGGWEASVGVAVGGVGGWGRMRVGVAGRGGDGGARRVGGGVLATCVLAVVGALTACGSGGARAATVVTPPPTQPSYPSTPPVPITWSPQTSALPAPTAQVPPPWPNGSNDFPLTISSPSDGSTVTSPATVVAS